MANSFSTTYYASYQINATLEVKSYWWLLYPDEFTSRAHKIVLIFPDGNKVEKMDEGNVKNRFWSFTVELNQLGSYKLEYYRSTGTSDVPTELEVSYHFSAVENKLPLKKWTITEVINRLLSVAEPIRKDQKPRFKLNDEQAKTFDKIRSPEFSFTKQTLRECLQEIGQFIHGEPRLTPKREEIYTELETLTFTNGRAALGNILPNEYDLTKQYFVDTADGRFAAEIVQLPQGQLPPMWFIRLLDGNKYNGQGTVLRLDYGEYIFEISYDMWASQEQSGIWTKKYIQKTVSQVIDSYTAWLDSSAENLINQLDKKGGVIIEPYNSGAKSVRAENTYVRITDENMIIATQYPIYTVDKLEYLYVDGDGAMQTVDLTAWLFERSIYETELSSYDNQYPTSKAYGIYYTQGEKNIGGLNFKVDSAVAAPFNDYAIVNIIRQATGNPSLFPFEPLTDEAKNQFPRLAFRVTYTPIYNVRVGQTKVNYKDFKRPAGLIYNQAANVIESRYYGENLKGAVARIGNIDLSLTYRLYRLGHVPKAGQMYDKNYYISAVAVEYLPNCILCTMGLSKDFNRLSAYIGINSEKRYSEVSQTQSVERNTLWREYVVIGDRETPDSGCLTGRLMMYAISDTFVHERVYSAISNVSAWGSSYKGNDLNVVSLPVIASAFGNSMSFSWEYEDNYSAGAVSHYEDKEGGLQGYFQNNYPYADYYGRMYYYNFDLQPYGITPVASTLIELATGLPKGVKPVQSTGYVSTIGRSPYILRKDNREILQCNFQIDFVSNTDIIIGSALAANCPAVRGGERGTPAKLYVFPTELNKFTDHIEAWEDVDLNSLPSADISTVRNSNQLILNAGNFPARGKSWAIVTKQTQSSPEEVEDEEGNTFEQKETYGGDLLIGRNQEVLAGQAFTPIYFTLKREIFDKTVWKDRR